MEAAQYGILSKLLPIVHLVVYLIAYIVLPLLNKEDLITLAKLICQERARLIHPKFEAIKQVDHERTVIIMLKSIVRIREFAT